MKWLSGLAPQRCLCGLADHSLIKKLCQGNRLSVVASGSEEWGLTLRSRRTSTGMALGPRSARCLSFASRAKRHPGSGPLSSNVRQHHGALSVLAVASGAAVAAEYQMPSSATFMLARHSKSGNAQVPRSALLRSQFRLLRFAATDLCLSMRSVWSVGGAAATRKALPSFTVGGGGGMSSCRTGSQRWRICDE